MPTATSLPTLRDRLQTRIQVFLDERRPEMAGVDPDCAELAEATAELLAGGKRLRAAFCYAGWLAAAPPDADDTPAVEAGAALELFQAAALIHDDLIDNSDLRRGRPAVHRRIEAWHGERGWAGDAAQFGRGGAVLAGDLALMWARNLIATAVQPLAPDTATATLRAYDAMSFQLASGQFLDMLGQVRPPGADALHQARQVIHYKTVQYSVVQPLRLGATMAGAGPDLLQALTDYGTPVGEAFQLRDDLLGVFGNPETTGKPAGDDLREGKRTVLLELARQALDEPARARLDEAVGRDDLTADDLEALGRLIEGSGAVAVVERLITGLHQKAVTVLDSGAIPAAGTDLLRDLAARAIRRSA